MVVDTTLLQDMEAETSTLGSMMVDSAVIADVLMIIPHDRGDWFYRTDHRNIFTSLVSLFQADVPIDAVILRADLIKRGWFEEIGGMPYLVELAESVTSSAHAEHHAKIVRELGRRRDIIAAMHSLRDAALDREATPSDICRKIATTFVNLAAVDGSRATTEDLQSLVEDVVAEMERGDPHTGIPTGIPFIDGRIVGLVPGNLMVVAARPSVGKTALALQIASHVANRQAVPVGIFSMEMGSRELARRIAVASPDGQRRRFLEGPMQFSEIPQIGAIRIDETPGLTASQVVSRATAMRELHGVKLIVVDYLQLMKDASGAKQSKYQEISNIARDMKNAARTLDMPIILLCQMNRSIEKEDRRPRMSDLRESGAIEEVADMLFFIHRQKADARNDNGNEELWLILEKHRNGPTGAEKVLFHRPTMTFHRRHDWGQVQEPV